MNRLLKTVRGGLAVSFLSRVLLFLMGAVTYSPSLDVTVQTLAAAAQPTLQSAPDARISAQPFIPIAQQAKAAVVNISAVKKENHQSEQGSGPFFDDPFFRRFFGEEFERRMPAPRERREQGFGSGVIVASDGYIVTNNHVVTDAEELTVSLPDKRTFKAKIIGTDPKTDVAVIKIDASNLPVLSWGDAGQLQVGELVLAVGNPFGLSQTVTMGIISAVGRANMGIVDYEDFIQTDAAINPGNSGGALVNLKGELIGIPSAIFSQTGGSMGIGFAIPSNMAKSVMNNLIKHGKVVRGWIGISIQEINQDLAKEFGTVDTKGALVADVMDDSPAAKAKLERGDIITSYNGVTVRDPGQLRALVAETAPSTTVALSILRERKTQHVTVIIGELPKELAKTRPQDGDSSKGEHALAGITVENISNSSERFGRSKGRAGVVVTAIEPDSPAERAGMRTGDIISEINRKPVKDVKDFERHTSQLTPKSSVLLLLNRGNTTIFLSITGER